MSVELIKENYLNKKSVFQAVIKRKICEISEQQMKEREREGKDIENREKGRRERDRYLLRKRRERGLGLTEFLPR